MERTMISWVFLVWLFMLSNGCNLLFEVDAHASEEPTKLKLIHRHSPELGENTGTSLGAPKNSKERIQQLAHSDHARVQMISQRLGRKIDAELLSKLNLTELPMRSAADLGVGQYFVSMRVGTPSKKFLLVVDTGSTLSWIACRYKCTECWKDKLMLKERVFCANESTTFMPLPCSDPLCHPDTLLGASRDICETPEATCGYDYSYLDGTQALGYLATETVKIRLGSGKKAKITNVTFGCTETLVGAASFYQLDGVLGLGVDPLSFVLQAAQMFGDKFSYCLVDHMSPANRVNFLIFGGIRDSKAQVPNVQHTEMVIHILEPYYALNVTGISLNDKMVDIPSYIWVMDAYTKTGGMILDSGTSLTMLVEPAYDKLIAAFLPYIRNFKKVPEASGMDHCFHKQGYNETLIPRLAILFADGAKFEPPVKSYVIDASESSLCLGFRPLPWPGICILGNIIQQNYLWEFDFLKLEYSFAPSTCTFD